MDRRRTTGSIVGRLARFVAIVELLLLIRISYYYYYYYISKEVLVRLALHWIPGIGSFCFVSPTLRLQGTTKKQSLTWFSFSSFYTKNKSALPYIRYSNNNNRVTSQGMMRSRYQPQHSPSHGGINDSSSLPTSQNSPQQPLSSPWRKGGRTGVCIIPIILVVLLVCVTVPSMASLWWLGLGVATTTTSNKKPENVDSSFLASTTTTTKTSSSLMTSLSAKKKTPADWEREARAEQAAFCQSLLAADNQATAEPTSSDGNDSNNMIRRPRVSVQQPLAVQGVAPAATAVTYNLTVPLGGQAFTIMAYVAHDKVSQSMQTPERFGGGWELPATRDMIQKVQEYAKKAAAARSKTMQQQQEQQESSSLPLENVRFIDIGANVGWFTMVMASLGVKVIAVEPMAANLQLLRETLCLPQNQPWAQNVVLHSVGVSDHTRPCLVYSDMKNFGDGMLYCHATEKGLHEFVPPPRYFVRGRTHVVRLDDLVETDTGNVMNNNPKKKPIVAIKMDTEGHENLILQGGQQVLLHSRVPVIYSEFNAAWIAEWGGGNPQGFMQSFLDAGYTLKRNGEVLERSYALDMQNWQDINDVVFEYQHP